MVSRFFAHCLYNARRRWIGIEYINKRQLQEVTDRYSDPFFPFVDQKKALGVGPLRAVRDILVGSQVPEEHPMDSGAHAGPGQPYPTVLPRIFMVTSKIFFYFRNNTLRHLPRFAAPDHILEIARFFYHHREINIPGPPDYSCLKLIFRTGGRIVQCKRERFGQTGARSTANTKNHSDTLHVPLRPCIGITLFCPENGHGRTPSVPENRLIDPFHPFRVNQRDLKRK